MKTLLKTAIVATLLAGASQPALAAPAKPVAAPAATAGVNGIAIANMDAVLYNSAAFKKAQIDREVQYKPQIEAAKAAEAKYNDQIKAVVEKFKKDRVAPGTNVATLQAAAQAQVQQIQQTAKAEVEQIMAPVSLSDAYVAEQIADKRVTAVVNAMNKTGVTLLLSNESVINVTTNAYNLIPAIITELDALLPSAQIVPPAGWLPREIREQQARQGGGQPQAGQSSGDGR